MAWPNGIAFSSRTPASAAPSSLTPQIAGQLGNLVTYNLPDSYFNEYITKVNAVTIADVNRVANKYLTPDKMAILIVGDRKVIEPRLREIEGLGSTIRYLDADGNPVD